MPERTYLPIQDKALRQVHAAGLHNFVGTIALNLADYFTVAEPTDYLTTPVLQRLAHAYIREHTTNEAYATETYRTLFRLLPTPRPVETRGEFALRIRAIVRRTHA